MSCPCTLQPRRISSCHSREKLTPFKFRFCHHQLSYYREIATSSKLRSYAQEISIFSSLSNQSTPCLVSRPLGGSFHRGSFPQDIKGKPGSFRCRSAIIPPLHGPSRLSKGFTAVPGLPSRSSIRDRQTGIFPRGRGLPRP